MDELPAPRPFSLRDHWLLLPVLLIAAQLRVWQIHESLWLDELHSAWVVSAGASEIAERAQIGNQSPLYFYILWATTSLFGMSEWTLRLPSLVAGVGLVAIAYGLVYQFTRSPIAAAASSLLAAFDHNFLFYATETRPYAFVQLLAAVQLSILWNLQTASTTRGRIAFVVSSVGLFYIHYTAILLLAGEVVYFVSQQWWCRQRTDVSAYTIRRSTIDLLCIAAMTTPALAHLLDIGARRNAWGSFINDTSLLLPVRWFSLTSYVGVPAIVCLVLAIAKVAITLRRDEPTTRDAVLLTTANGATIASSIGSSRRSVTATFLLACWLGVPLAIVWLLTVTKVAPLYLGRYVIGGALAPVLFAGLCVAVLESRRSQALAACLLIGYAVYASGMIEQFRHDRRLFGDRVENWRDAVRYVNDNRVGSSPVFVRSGLLEADRLATDDSNLLRDYCVSPVTSIYRIDGLPSEILPLTTRAPGKLTKEDVKRIEASGTAWFIINGTTATRDRCAEAVSESLGKEIQMATYSKTQGGLVTDERQFGHVGVFTVLVYTVDDQVEPLDAQPTSPNSNAPP